MTLEQIAEKYATWFLGACLSVGMYVHKLYLDRLKEQTTVAKAERDKAKHEVEEICNRLEKVEEVDKSAYPAFVKLQEDFKNISETVKTHHEQRLQGLATANERLGENFNLKLDNALNRVDGLEKRLDKIDNKLDRIMDAIGKIPHA